MIKSQRHKSERRPPDRDDLAEILSRHESEEASQTDEPVGADATEEDLMPSRRDDFRIRERFSFVVVKFRAEDAAVPGYDSHYKERAREVPEEGHSPMDQHFED